MSSLRQTLEITLLDVRAIPIHGSPYFEVTYQERGNDAVQQMRINPEAFYADPRSGDRVRVDLLMGNIMGAVKLD